ncbi:MAG: flagellar motor protein MotB [Rickettsiales bacterium]
MADKNQTIIIKKIKKGGHGHHGGAWKVAYADFVTAMMAFFLLLWLLTSTPVENLQGLADYFSPTMGMQGKLGIGFKGGRAPNTEGYSTGDWASKGLIFGAPPSGPIIRLPGKPEEAAEDNPRVDFNVLNQSSAKGELESAFKSYQNITVSVTPDGMEIQIYDLDNKPLFGDRDAVLTDAAKNILGKATSIMAGIPNYIRIAAYTPVTKEIPTDPYPTGWELSSARANAVRRQMTASGMDAQQFAEMSGMADHELKNEEKPDSPENSRIVITLLKKIATGLHKKSAPEALLMRGRR